MEGGDRAHRFDDVPLEVRIGSFELVRLEHQLRHERRRRYHFHPEEHRQVLVVTLVASSAVEAKEVAGAEVVAVRANGERLVLDHRGGIDDRRRFEVVYGDGEGPLPSPVAYVVDGQTISVE